MESKEIKEEKVQNGKMSEEQKNTVKEFVSKALKEKKVKYKDMVDFFDKQNFTLEKI